MHFKRGTCHLAFIQPSLVAIRVHTIDILPLPCYYYFNKTFCVKSLKMATRPFMMIMSIVDQVYYVGLETIVETAYDYRRNEEEKCCGWFFTVHSMYFPIQVGTWLYSDQLRVIMTDRYSVLRWYAPSIGEIGK